MYWRCQPSSRWLPGVSLMCQRSSTRTTVPPSMTGPIRSVGGLPTAVSRSSLRTMTSMGATRKSSGLFAYLMQKPLRQTQRH